MSDQAPEKLQAAAELERRRAAFIAGVSHDLKTPLNGIIGFTSVLMIDVAGRDPDQERNLKMVYESAQLMLERIDALVLFHRLEAGIQPTKFDWLSPIDLLRQTTEQHRQSAEKEGMAIELVDGGPRLIRSDLRLLGRALGEVLSNAVRFGRKGRVRVWLESGPEAGRTRLALCVADEGIGLRPEALDKLRRGLRPAQAQDHFEGQGLGLALARLSMEKLGGWIEVESDYEAGSTFRLCLDLAGDHIQGATPTQD